jgi:hypothetical protein
LPLSVGPSTAVARYRQSHGGVAQAVAHPGAEREGYRGTMV